MKFTNKWILDRNQIFYTVDFQAARLFVVFTLYKYNEYARND